MDPYHGVHDEPERSLDNPPSQGSCHQEVATVGGTLATANVGPSRDERAACRADFRVRAGPPLGRPRPLTSGQ